MLGLGLSIARSNRSGRFMAPQALPTLPISLQGFDAAGRAVTNWNAKEAFQNSSLFTYNDTPLYVSSAGVAGNNGLTPGAPTTIAAAVRTYTTGSRIVLLDNMTIEPLDIRSTDASQAGGPLGKLIDPDGNTLTIRTSGPDLTAQTYVQDGTNTNCYTTTLTLSGTAAFQRLLRTDGVDDYGFHVPFAKYASAAALNAGVGDGFFWDNVGKVLWVKIGNGENVQAQRAILRGLYTGSAGTSRNFCSGAPLCITGARMEGVQNVTLDASSRLPQIYLHDTQQLWAVSKGADLTQCGLYVASDLLCYASEADGANAFATSAVAKGLIQTINSQFVRAGDRRTFAADHTLQGVSAHGGSNHVSFGAEFIGNNGQGVADTCANNSHDVTWLVGCTVQGGNTTAANIQVGSAATSASRTGYFDNVTSIDAPAAGDLVISTNGVARTYRTTFAAVTGTPTPYVPGAA
jgi:hypothetical protein